MLKEDITTIRIEYLDNFSPPPFAHQYVLEIDCRNKFPQLQYSLSYLERDTLSEEDILDEGFTPDDDFSWQGNLTLKWHQIIQETLKQWNWSPIREEVQRLYVEVNTPAGSTLHLKAEQEEEALLFVQELIQALYEKSKKEHPLVIEMKEVMPDGKAFTFHLEASFLHRRITVEGKPGNLHRSHNWNTLFPLLERIDTLEFDISRGQQKPGKKPGAYLNFGDGAWYHYSTAIKATDKKAGNELLNYLRGK
jgi:DNA-dependent RNA polymerase auxiliary subunit epsilon